MTTTTTHGTTAPGYERVAELFDARVDLLGRGGSAFAVFRDGQPVVDLWGGSARPGQPWQQDTLGVLMSVTKALAGLCTSILVDRGQLDIGQLVTHYWPEYGQNGKAGTRVDDFFKHSAGMLGFPNPHDLLKWDGTGFDQYDEIARRIAEAPPQYEPGTKHAYHALSYGWLVGELVRRIDGRSIGTFFRDELAQPLDLDMAIGLPAEELSRVAQVLEPGYHAVPRAMKGQVAGILESTRDPSTLNGIAFLGDGTTSGIERMHDLLNAPALLVAEFASGGGVTTARSLAKLFALIGARGMYEGRTYISPETLASLEGVVTQVRDELAMETARTRGQKKRAEAGIPRIGPWLGNTVDRIGLPDMFGPNPNAAGGAGAGGQLAFFDRDHGLAFGYLRSHMALVDMQAPGLVETVYRCAIDLGHAPASVIPTHSMARRRLDRALDGYLTRVELRSLN